MEETEKKRASYGDLCRLPDNMVGEIIDGDILASPCPSARHSNVASALVGDIVPPYQFGRNGGPGGWIILYEVEVMLGDNLLVPDLAGWRRERFSEVPGKNWISVAPDWVCEILSPRTVRLDKVGKMPLYAAHGVAHLWFVDYLSRILDVYRQESGRWFLVESFADADRARTEPFREIEIEMKNFWLE